MPDMRERIVIDHPTPAPRLVQFTRYPDAGKCKSRLIPAVGPKGAAAIHRHLTEHVFAQLTKTNCPVTLAYTGASGRDFQQWLGPDQLGGEVTFAPQPEGDLSQRLIAFIDDAPIIFFGSDTPDLSDAHVEAAIEGLKTHRLVIGPALDGGYYLIGMREPLPQLLDDMPWSTDQVMPETLRRAQQMGIEPLLLEPLSDCDVPNDLLRWPSLVSLASEGDIGADNDSERRAENAFSEG